MIGNFILFIQRILNGLNTTTFTIDGVRVSLMAFIMIPVLITTAIGIMWSIIENR